MFAEGTENGNLNRQNISNISFNMKGSTEITKVLKSSMKVSKSML